MVIGHGDIASVIIDKEYITFFASGVSNSREERQSEYEREIKLLCSQFYQQHLVYFSSLCVYDSNTRYAQHKRYMEQMIKSRFDSYTIVRIGNIDWGVNPNTLINYLKANPEAEVQNVWRHIIDKNEFQYWIAKVRVGYQDEMNVPGRMVWVPDLFNQLHGNNKP
jgi:hypothetical protein